MAKAKIMICVDEDALQKIDEIRETDVGKVSRSGFINNLIVRALEASHD